MVHALEHVVQRRLPGRLQRGGRRSAGPVRGRRPAGQALRARAPALGHRAGGGRGAPAGRADPAGDAQPAALRPRRGQPAAEGRGLRVRPHQPRGGDRARRAPAPAPADARRRAEPYRYEREVEEFLRWSPNVRNSRVRDSGGLSRDEMQQLQRLLAGYGGPGMPGAGQGAAPAAAPRRRTRPEPAPEPVVEPPARRSTTTTTWRPRRSSRCWARSSPPTWRRSCAYERDHRAREAVVGAIESVLVARRRASHGRLSAKSRNAGCRAERPMGKRPIPSLHFLVASSTG